MPTAEPERKYQRQTAGHRLLAGRVRVVKPVLRVGEAKRRFARRGVPVTLPVNGL